MIYDSLVDIFIRVLFSVKCSEIKVQIEYDNSDHNFRPSDSVSVLCYFREAFIKRVSPKSLHCWNVYAFDKSCLRRGTHRLHWPFFRGDKNPRKILSSAHVVRTLMTLCTVHLLWKQIMRDTGNTYQKPGVRNATRNIYNSCSWQTSEKERMKHINNLSKSWKTMNNRCRHLGLEEKRQFFRTSLRKLVSISTKIP